MAIGFAPIPSHCHKFQSHFHSNSHASQLFPFPLFSHTDILILIPFHSHSQLPYINDYVEHLMEIATVLSF